MIELILGLGLLIAGLCTLRRQTMEYGILAVWVLLAIGAVADPIIAWLAP